MRQQTSATACLSRRVTLILCDLIQITPAVNQPAPVRVSTVLPHPYCLLYAIKPPPSLGGYNVHLPTRIGNPPAALSPLAPRLNLLFLIFLAPHLEFRLLARNAAQQAEGGGTQKVMALC